MTRPKHILVTGAAGFLGSHLLRELLGAGHRVTGVDDLSAGSRGNLDGLPEGGWSLWIGDAAKLLSGDPEGVEAASVDAVFHLAASVGVQKVVHDPTGSAENNLDQTRAALAFAGRAGCPVLIASSSEVYGKCPRVPCRETDDLTFGPPGVARWSYGLAKALDEQLALDAARRTGRRVVVARLFNAIGAGQTGEHGMVVPRFVAAAAKGGSLEVHGSGHQTRCFCDAIDVASSLASLLLGPGEHSGVFNVGGDEEIEMGALAALVQARARAAGLPGGTITHRTHEEVYGARFEEPQRRAPDLAKLRAALGDRARVPLADTLDRLLVALDAGAGASE